MDQAGAVLGAEAQPVELAVEVLYDPRAALHRQTERLVEHQHELVAPDHHALKVFHHVRAHARGGDRRRALGQRRDADGLAGAQPGIGLDAAAIDPDLAGAAEFLHRGLGDVREVATEPAIKP